MKTRSTSRTGEESRRGVFAASVAIHVLLLGVFPFLVANFKKNDPPEKIEVVFYPRQVEPRVQPPAPVPPPVEAEPPEPKLAEVVPPAPTRTPPPPRREAPAPAPQPVKVARKEPPPAPPRPEPPRKQVRTALFEQQAAQAAPPKPVEKQARTGMFAAAEEAVPAPRPDNRLRAAARVGEFATETASPVDARPEKTEPRVVARAEFGGTADPVAAPPRPSREGATVQPTGFGGSGGAGNTGAGQGRASASGEPSGSVSTGEFGDGIVDAPARPTRKPAEPSPDTPVEILSKARPVYTTEARQQKIEGEVVIKVIFDSSGEMRVIGIVEGLGHGLDEAAVEAARKIKFNPARRDGKAVDHAAVLRIVFQLV